MRFPLPLFALNLALVLGLASTPAVAERADRDKPVDIEADRMSVDDRNKVHVFEGSVVLTQGTLVIRSDKLVVSQDANGFQSGIATASGSKLATFRQKRDGGGQVEGEAERIEYDSRNEQAKLYRRARVASNGDEVRGNYIEYDALSENYLAAQAPGNAPAAPGSGRVRAVIQPKGDNRPEGQR
jgi:lipopolysaccharide export system protein LptA